MARPIYETAQDRANEEEIATLLAERYNAKAIKAKRLYGLDWFFERDGYVVGMVEIKVRNYASTDFNTYMISADKIARIRMLSSVSGIPSFLFVAWTDTVGYINLADTPDYTAIGGRRDRGDPQDIEVLLHYSVDRFIRV
jgi:hypothetical protein